MFVLAVFVLLWWYLVLSGVVKVPKLDIVKVWSSHIMLLQVLI